jgi:hypothetical protein
MSACPTLAEWAKKTSKQAASASTVIVSIVNVPAPIVGLRMPGLMLSGANLVGWWKAQGLRGSLNS